MKMYNQAQRIKQWGNQMDPEVTAETYLESEDAAAADWARENEQELQQLDKDTINLYRRHRENADFRSLDALRTKRKPAESGQDPAKRRGNLPTQPDKVWIDRMLSQKPEDFEKLVENPQLAKALESLTPRQKEVVFQTFMKQRTPQQIAERLKTSDRNVRDVLTRAIANIKKILIDNSGESYMDTVVFTLLWMTVPTFVIGWHISSWLYPKLKKAVLGKAA